MRTGDDDALTESAGRIADGEPIDWAAEAEHAPERAHELAALERVARIAEGWRAIGVTPAADDDGAAETVALRWGPLEAREKLGEGAFGEVWRAWDPALRREVALKLRRAGDDDASARHELDEARRLARVRHPNVLAIHGVDVHDGRAGLWTDLVRGATLETLLAERGPFGAHEAALVGTELCRALAAVHAAGLVHGDVKAANVMREDGGRIVLTDFGSGRDADTDAFASVTASPLSAAPELLRGAAPSAASDLYSLGALLFRLVTGRHPVEATTLAALRDAHARGARTSLRALRPELPTAFVAAVEHALDPDPARRFGDAGAFELALDRATSAPVAGVAAPRVRRNGTLAWSLASVAAALVLVRVVLALRGHSPAPASPSPVATAPSAVAPVPDGAAVPVPAPRPDVAITLWRSRDGVKTALADGDPVQPGDHLWLEFRGGEPLHVYVLDEDDRGQTFALFPVAGTDLANPVRAKQRVRLPGTRDGVPFDWVVTSDGGHERLLVVASRTPLAPLAELVAASRPASAEEPVAYAEVGEGAMAALRGIGGMAPAGDAREGRLSAVERALASRTDGGFWTRHIVLAAR